MIEKPIPKEIKEFREKIVFGLNFKQLIFSLSAGIICIPTYIVIKNYTNEELASWIIIGLAMLIAIIVFYREEAIDRFIFLFLVPTQRMYKTSNFFEELEEQAKEKAKKGKKGK